VSFAEFMAIHIIDKNGVAHLVASSPYGSPIYEPQDSGFFAGTVTVRLTIVIADGGGEADCLMFFPMSVPIGHVAGKSDGDNGGCTTGRGPPPAWLAAPLLLAVLRRKRRTANIA
jgi:MYXO-CTERM domain-containing protein